MIKLKRNVLLSAISLATIVAPAFAVAQQTTLFTLDGPKACCKVNCSHYGYSDCKNVNERQIASIPVSGTKKIIIRGRGNTSASSCYQEGKVNTVFMSDSGKIYNKNTSIPCHSSKSFQVVHNFESEESGILEVYIGVSDWCTAMDNLVVIAE